MAGSILLILGPSGAGKTTLGDFLQNERNILHINFDRPDTPGVDIEKLRHEWNSFLDERNPNPIVKAIHNRVRENDWNGAAITCPSGIVPSSDPHAKERFLSKDYLKEMEAVGFYCVVIYGSREECLRAFLTRDPNENEKFWNDNNIWWYPESAFHEFWDYLVQAFRRGCRRRLHEIFAEIQERLKL